MPVDGRRADSVGDGSGAAASDHVDVEVMAAYVDGATSTAERDIIHRHIADCTRCREALSDLALSVAEERGAAPATVVEPFRRRRLIIGAASGLAAAALVLAVLGWQMLGRSNPSTPDLRPLIVAVATLPTRPVEGRLSANFPYAAPPPVTRGTATLETPPDLRVAAGELEAAAGPNADPPVLWAAAIARLTTADPSGAVMLLEDATRRDPSNAAMWSDLAAAYLARGRSGRSTTDLNEALRAADRALQTAPRNAAALFNRAVALAALQSAETAAAWQAFLDVEPGSEWSAEARRRLNGTP